MRHYKAMRHNKAMRHHQAMRHYKARLLMGALLLFTLGVTAFACGQQGGANQEGEKLVAEAISANNDEVTSSAGPTVTDPNANMNNLTESQGSVMAPGAVAPTEPAITRPEQLLQATTGAVPPVAHGSTRGTECLSCHESGSGGAPADPKSHKEANLTNEYCLNCHALS